MSVNQVGSRGPVDYSQDVDASQSAGAADASQAAGAAASPHKTATQGRVPGEKADVSGQYVLRDSKGTKVGSQRTIAAGESFPPARAGLSYHLIDATKHTGGTGDGGAQFVKPGTKAKVSGQYELVDANGKGLDAAMTLSKGEKVPPTPGANQQWKLVDMTGTKRAGEKVELSGQYGLVDSNGKLVKNSETTAVKGEKFPPTPKAGQAWKLVDVSVHIDKEMAKGDIKPGQKALVSGQYALIRADGTKTGREVTVSAGERMPPTGKKGDTYKLVDKTNP